MRRFTLLLLILTTVVSCRGPERATTEAGAAAAFPEEGGTLYRRLKSEPATLNFVKSTTLDEKYVISLTHDALIDWNDELTLVPGLAKAWEISDDLRTYRFTLDPRATWSDGEKVEPSDVLFTLRRIVDPENPSPQFAGMFEALDLDRSRVVDDQTVEIRFRNANSSTIQSFNIPMLPEHVYAANDEPEKPVGSGPYVLESREKGKTLTLKRRADYWRGSPFLDRVVFRVLEDDATAWNAMKLGEIDETVVSSDRWLSDRNLPSVTRHIDFHLYYELEYSFIAWNNRNPVLSDPQVRRAMTMSLDRKTIIETIYQGTARIITGPYTPDQRAYNPEVDAIRYDLDAAGVALDRAGLMDTDGDGWRDRDGEEVSVTLIYSSGSDISRQVGEILQDALRQVGFRLELEPLDRSAFFGRVIGGDFDGAVLAWGIDPDPDLYSTFHSAQTPPGGQNFIFYRNPAVDALIMEGRREADEDRRTEIYHRIHALLAEDQPYTWIVQEKKKHAVSKRVRDVGIGRGIGLFLWHPGPFEWWIPADQRKEVAAEPEREAATG